MPILFQLFGQLSKKFYSKNDSLINQSITAIRVLYFNPYILYTCKATNLLNKIEGFFDKNIQKEMYQNLRLNFYFYKSYRKAKFNVIVLDLIKSSFHTN
jgi:hypothetical protein